MISEKKPDERLENALRGGKFGSAEGILSARSAERRLSRRDGLAAHPQTEPSASEKDASAASRSRLAEPETRAEVLPRAKRSKEAFPGAGKTKDAQQRTDGVPAAGAEGRRGNRAEKGRDGSKKGGRLSAKHRPSETTPADGEGPHVRKPLHPTAGRRTSGQEKRSGNPGTAWKDKRSAANAVSHRQRQRAPENAFGHRIDVPCPTTPHHRRTRGKQRISLACRAKKSYGKRR
ncbi:hypothetical protein [uncultured Mailhella sp.]|uniref:hypothetical protein n=1 Tax=uncultured Mailhella sp. TaxID=1981031 RepID=UPI0025CFFACD|nr:hypothetical protein [uncultured Mailhella sp.]